MATIWELNVKLQILLSLKYHFDSRRWFTDWEDTNKYEITTSRIVLKQDNKREEPRVRKRNLMNRSSGLEYERFGGRGATLRSVRQQLRYRSAFLWWVLSTWIKTNDGLSSYLSACRRSNPWSVCVQRAAVDVTGMYQDWKSSSQSVNISFTLLHPQLK